MLTLLRAHLSSSPFPIETIEMSLGGSTSIDIYPLGWNKTYAIRHLDVSKCFFVGDKCFGSGNDRQIYERIKSEGLGAYSVINPQETSLIIKQIQKSLKLGDKNG